MSSMRSASSRTRISTWPRLTVALADVVEQPAGRGDEDLDAARAAALICGSMGTPP